MLRFNTHTGKFIRTVRETSLIERVKKGLRGKVMFIKQAPFGVPDYLAIGKTGVCFIEFKSLVKIDKRGMKEKGLRPSQVVWLKEHIKAPLVLNPNIQVYCFIHAAGRCYLIDLRKHPEQVNIMPPAELEANAVFVSPYPDIDFTHLEAVLNAKTPRPAHVVD